MEVDKQLDRIYDWMDDLMWAGRLDEISRILCEVPVESTSTDLLLGYLTATLAVKDRVPGRDKFFQAAKEVIEQRGEMTPGLLVNLD
jgi:hypothetical protein